MRRLQIILTLLLLVLATAACKKTETTNETTTGTSSTDTYATTDSGMTGSTGMTGAMTLNDTDKDFVTSAERGGKAEVELAQDGVAHAANAEVKSFAQKLVD